MDEDRETYLWSRYLFAPGGCFPPDKNDRVGFGSGLSNIKVRWSTTSIPHGPTEGHRSHTDELSCCYPVSRVKRSRSSPTTSLHIPPTIPYAPPEGDDLEGVLALPKCPSPMKKASPVSSGIRADSEDVRGLTRTIDQSVEG